MKFTIIPILAVTICLAAPFTSYGAGQLSLVMVPKGVHPYYEPCYQGFKDAGIKYGVKTEYRAAKAFEVPQEVEATGCWRCEPLGKVLPGYGC
jgi:ribose transport system substrate-binding protein